MIQLPVYNCECVTYNLGIVFSFLWHLHVSNVSLFSVFIFLVLVGLFCCGCGYSNVVNICELLFSIFIFIFHVFVYYNTKYLFTYSMRYSTKYEEFVIILLLLCNTVFFSYWLRFIAHVLKTESMSLYMNPLYEHPYAKTNMSWSSNKTIFNLV